MENILNRENFLEKEAVKLPTKEQMKFDLFITLANKVKQEDLNRIDFWQEDGRYEKGKNKYPSGANTIVSMLKRMYEAYTRIDFDKYKDRILGDEDLLDKIAFASLYYQILTEFKDDANYQKDWFSDHDFKYLGGCWDECEYTTIYTNTEIEIEDEFGMDFKFPVKAHLSISTVVEPDGDDAIKYVADFEHGDVGDQISFEAAPMVYTLTLNGEKLVDNKKTSYEFAYNE